MLPKPMSAADAVTPSIETTKWFMFKPFQWARWWRVAMIGMAMAVIGTANGCNLAGLGNLKEFSKATKELKLEQLDKLRSMISEGQIAFFITVLVVGLLVLAVVHIYVNSVARFMMFDGLTTGRFRLRQGWSRWHSKGLQLFPFQLGLGILTTAILSGTNYLFMVLSQSLETGGRNAGLALLYALLTLGLTSVFSIAALMIFVMAKDFAVPVLALENIGLGEAFSKVWRITVKAPVDFIVYCLIKFLINIVVGMILVVVEIVVLIIPVIVLVFLGAMLIAALGKSDNIALMVAAGVTAAFVGIGSIWALSSIVAAPAHVFFQSFVLHYFSARYEPLWTLMHPAAPPIAPPSAPPPISTMDGPPPEPSPAM